MMWQKWEQKGGVVSPTGVLWVAVLQRRAGRACGFSPGRWTRGVCAKPDIISVSRQGRDSCQVLGIVGSYGWEKPSEGGWPGGACLNLGSSSPAPADARGPPKQLQGKRSEVVIAETWDPGNGRGKPRPAGITLLLGRAPSSPRRDLGFIMETEQGTSASAGEGSQAKTFPWAVLEVMGAGQRRMHP